MSDAPKDVGSRFGSGEKLVKKDKRQNDDDVDRRTENPTMKF